jgi:putative flippase GtrA
VRPSALHIRYLAAGCHNTVFGYGLFALLYWLLHRRVNYLIILVVSHTVSVVNAYLVYRFFVFRVQGRFVADGVRFALVYGLVIAANVALLPLLVHAGAGVLAAQAVLVAATVAASYLGHKHFSFRRTPWGQVSPGL